MPDTRTEPGMKSEIGELIERLGKATGPGRELDLAIQAWLDPEAPILFGAGTKKAKWGSYRDIPSAEGQDIPNLISVINPPSYSESIDAALTLKPEGWSFTLVGGTAGVSHSFATVSLSVPSFEKPSRGATPAIALCIAALRARMEVKG